MTSIRSTPRAVGGAPSVRPRRHPVAIVVFAVVAALLPFDRVLLADASISVPFWRGFLLFLALCVLGNRWSRPAFPGVWLSALVLIPLGGAISGLTTNVNDSVTIAIQIALLCCLAPFVIRYYLLWSRSFLCVVGGAFVLAQTMSAIVAMLQLAGVTVLDTTLIFGRTTGLAGHPNVLGIMSVIALVGCVVALGRIVRPLRIVVLAAAVLNALALVFSGSLSAMLAGLLALFIALSVKRRLVFAFIAVVLGGAFVFLLGVFSGLDATSLLDPVSTRVDVVLGTSDVEGGAASVDTRILTYEWAWRFISDNPLVGVGMDARNAGTYNGVTPVHNYILHAWYRGGLFFFFWQILATVAYIGVIVRAFRARRWAGPASLVAAVMMFAATSAFYTQQAYWLPLLLGMACFPGRPRPRDANLASPFQAAVALVKPSPDEYPTAEGIPEGSTPAPPPRL